MIDYYVRVAPRLLPHLAGRPLTLKRYPNGVDAPFFYEKRCPPHAPDWIERAPGDDPVLRRRRARVAGLGRQPREPRAAPVARPGGRARGARRWSRSTSTPARRPTSSTARGSPPTCATCSTLLGLECFPKTSGSKGMQVYVPLNTPTTYDATRAFSQAVAVTLERQLPDRVVATMAKQRRGRQGVRRLGAEPPRRRRRSRRTRCARCPSRPCRRRSPGTRSRMPATADDLTFTAPDVLARDDDPFAPVATLAAGAAGACCVSSPPAAS